MLYMKLFTQYGTESNMLFGEFLVFKNLITFEQVNHALTIQTQRQRQLGCVLVQMQLLSQDTLNEILSNQEMLCTINNNF